MNVTVNEVDQHKVTLHIEVPAKDASKQAAAACKNLASRVNIPGFRKGKAPRMVLESFLGKDAVKQEVFEAIANKAYSDALDQEGIVPVTEPELNVITDEKGKDVVFEATVTKKPEVKLGEYKGITVAKDKVDVTDEDVAKELANLQKQHAKLVVAPEGTEIAKDDFAVIDFKGTVDGVAFEGGEGKSYPLQIGSGSFIPGFEEQLVGHKAGESFDITVTFPEDYGNEDLNGKEAVFETTLNYIKESVTPELTDDWVKENLGESMSLNSVDELKAFVKSTMLYDNQASDVYTALHDKASYADELPQTALDYYRDVLLYRIYTNAQKYGTDMNALLSSGMMGSSYDSVDAYLADANDSIKSITQQALLMQAVAEKTGFKCDTATMNADFGRYYGTTDPSQYVSAYGENYIKMNVLQSDVMQNLIDNVKYE